MNWGSMRLNFERSSPDAPAANIRNPTDRRERLTNGTRWWIFMRLLQLKDLMTCYTNARPEAGLFARLPRPSCSRHPALVNCGDSVETAFEPLRQGKLEIPCSLVYWVRFHVLQ